MQTTKKAFARMTIWFFWRINLCGFCFTDTCFRTEITSKGKRHLSRQKVARRRINPLQKFDKVALVGNQHSKRKVSGKHINQKYLYGLPTWTISNQEEVVESIWLEGFISNNNYTYNKLLPLEFSVVIKKVRGLFMTFWWSQSLMKSVGH